jgi:hypothetical protein
VGAGAESRTPLGMAVVGGLVVSQFLTLYLTPVIYLYMDRLTRWLSGGKKTPRAAAPESGAHVPSAGVETPPRPHPA